jgi:hypothetical protein
MTRVEGRFHEELAMWMKEPLATPEEERLGFTAQIRFIRISASRASLTGPNEKSWE